MESDGNLQVKSQGKVYIWRGPSFLTPPPLPSPLSLSAETGKLAHDTDVSKSKREKREPATRTMIAQ